MLMSAKCWKINETRLNKFSVQDNSAPGFLRHRILISKDGASTWPVNYMYSQKSELKFTENIVELPKYEAHADIRKTFD